VIVWCIPGILEYPLLYDLGFAFLWLSFTAVGIIGGGIATTLKKCGGLDIRGRVLEVIVVAWTFLLAGLVWGLVWGFFLGADHCWGVMDRIGWNDAFSSSSFIPPSSPRESAQHYLPPWLESTVSYFMISVQNEPSAALMTDENHSLGLILTVIRSVILRPGKMAIQLMDNFMLKLDPRIARFLCVSKDYYLSDSSFSPNNNNFCLAISKTANPNFFLSSESKGLQCASDMKLSACIFLVSVFVALFGYFWRSDWAWLFGRGRVGGHVGLRGRGGRRRRRIIAGAGRRGGVREMLDEGRQDGEEADIVVDQRQHLHQD